jgi:hypothetical protein
MISSSKSIQLNHKVSSSTERVNDFHSRGSSAALHEALLQTVGTQIRCLDIVMTETVRRQIVPALTAFF